MKKRESVTTATPRILTQSELPISIPGSKTCT